MYYYGLVQERRAEPAGRHDQPADRRRDPRRERRDAQARRHRDHRLHQPFSAARGPRPSPSWSAARWSCSRNIPSSGRCCSTTAARFPAAVEELLRYVGPVQYNVRYSIKDVELPSGTVPANKPVFLMGAAANRDPRAFDDAETFDITRDRPQAQNLGLGYGIHSCLGAALARMESAIALDHLLDFMPRYEVDFDGLERVHMQNVAGYHHVPVKVLTSDAEDRGRFRPMREQRGVHGHHPRGVRSRRRGLPARPAGRGDTGERAADQGSGPPVPAQAIIDARRMTTSEVGLRPGLARSTSTDPWEIYKRMREEAPIYYDERAGLLRADAARGRGRGVQGLTSRSPRPAVCDLAMVRSDEPCRRRSIILMDPPEHRQMRSLLNKAFTPRAIQSQREMVIETRRALPRQGRPGQLRCGAGLLRPVPGRGDHADGRGARGIPPAGPALDRHQPAREPGQIDM